MKKNSWFISHSNNPFARINLVCFHHAGGSAAFFHGWPILLTPFVNVISVQLPGRDTRHGEPFVTEISAIINELMLQSQWIVEKPFVLFGHSLGSIIAFELVRELKKLSLSYPKCLIVSGRCSPNLSDAQEKIHHLPDALFLKRLIEKYGGINDTIQNSKELLAVFLPRIRADIYLSENYKYLPDCPLECPIFVMGGSSDPSVKQDDLLGWQQETNLKSKIYLFEGDHFFLESNKKNVLDRLNKILVSYL